MIHLNACLKEWNIGDKMEPLWNYHLRKCTLASVPWNDKKTTIEITTALKKIYPPNHEFKEREMRAWRAMLSHAGCTNITPYTHYISAVSYFLFRIIYNSINGFKNHLLLLPFNNFTLTTV